MFQIYVRINRTIVLEVEPTTTVLALKELIQDREGIPIRAMWLVHNGRVLDEEYVLSDYRIERESTVRCNIRAYAGETSKSKVE